MRLMFNGKEYFGPRGPAGPDGNPIGTVISYLGLSAPQDYLICDGREYNLSDYPDLAEFLRTQFGAANHFGGDGETTFAVPDFRNLFLRGYHGEAEEQLSGEVGVKQEGTEHLNTMFGGNNTQNSLLLMYTKGDFIRQNHFDATVKTTQNYGVIGENAQVYPAAGVSSDVSTFTSRPVNAAVLYCIKAVESFQAQDIYSTQETRLGTWIDGKPLYRRVYRYENLTINGESTAHGETTIPEDVSFLDTLVRGYWNGGYLSGARAKMYQPAYVSSSGVVVINRITIGNVPIPICCVVLEYTKTEEREV